jgi:hypothetical protein
MWLSRMRRIWSVNRPGTSESAPAGIDESMRISTAQAAIRTLGAST